MHYQLPSRSRAYTHANAVAQRYWPQSRLAQATSHASALLNGHAPLHRPARPTPAHHVPTRPQHSRRKWLKRALLAGAAGTALAIGGHQAYKHARPHYQAWQHERNEVARMRRVMEYEEQERMYREMQAAHDRLVQQTSIPLDMGSIDEDGDFVPAPSLSPPTPSTAYTAPTQPPPLDPTLSADFAAVNPNWNDFLMERWSGHTV